jgi:hypothetical protein
MCPRVPAVETDRNPEGIRGDPIDATATMLRTWRSPCARSCADRPRGKHQSEQKPAALKRSFIPGASCERSNEAGETDRNPQGIRGDPIDATATMLRTWRSPCARSCARSCADRARGGHQSEQKPAALKRSFIPRASCERSNEAGEGDRTLDIQLGRLTLYR